jgi:hypothetical protein
MGLIDLFDFMTKGYSLCGVSLNDTIEKVQKLLGKPLEKIGDKTAGFLIYTEGVRYGYFENEIDELAILFNEKNKMKYNFINDMNEKVEVSNKTQIHQFIYLLNTKKITWKCVDEKNIGAFIIIINHATCIYFDLDTGRLMKIFISRK